MSWASDAFADTNWRWPGVAMKQITSLGGFAPNDVSRFFEREFENKAALRGAQTEAALSGVPILGDILRGLNGVQSLDDLYNRTGKVAKYPSTQNFGAAGLGYGGTQLAKIASGKSDLYEFYSGEADDFRNMQNGMYW